jgi:voltage-gated potassium channel
MALISGGITIHKLTGVVAIFTTMVAVGTVGYIIIEGLPFLDALYMAMILMTTIGLGESRSLSETGRIFTIIYSFINFLLLAGIISVVSSAIVEGRIVGIYRRRRMQKAIARINGYIIVCGAGKIGRHVARELVALKHRFVIVDDDERYMKTLEDDFSKTGKDFYYVEGAPVREEVLLQANVMEAAGLITCMPDDAQNLFIALTAKKMNEKLRITCHASDEVDVKKFFLIGVDEVVSGDFIIGRKLAMTMQTDNVLAFLDQVNYMEGGAQIYLAECTCTGALTLGGKTASGGLAPAKGWCARDCHS